MLLMYYLNNLHATQPQNVLLTCWNRASLHSSVFIYSNFSLGNGCAAKQKSALAVQVNSKHNQNKHTANSVSEHNGIYPMFILGELNIQQNRESDFNGFNPNDRSKKDINQS